MNSDSSFVFLWTIFLWLFGWALLPLSRHVFRNLPDGGLAAVRIGGLALLSLLAFWLASLKLASLQLAPVYMIGAPPLCLALTLLRSEKRTAFFVWVKDHRGSLLFSDGVFLLSWFFFLWIRARNGGLGDLEKPMDAALLGALARAEYLPFDNPWLSGTPFTNYYYFGQLMGAQLTRALGTPSYIGYNLVQPAFCAFFVSTLWSLCAALTGSRLRGFVAAAMVALLGNFEPLRQMYETRSLWPLDWWKTTRVIPNTINEYPAFTMTIGDAHAHFFEMAVAAVFLALCHALFTNDASEGEENSLPHRDVVLMAIGALLGVIWLTNTWDIPVYALLALACALYTAPNFSFAEVTRCFLPLILAKFLAWPFTRISKPNVSGAVIDFWLPDAASFLLIWAGPVALVLPALGYWKERMRQNRFPVLVAAAGGLALAAPFCFYMRGVFGDGDMRHQDTVFKFGLQAWLLLGTAGACGALCCWSRWPLWKKVPAAAYLVIPALCSACVVWQRAWVLAPREIDGSIALSLNGARHLPPADQNAIAWLAANAKTGEAVLEAVSEGSYKPTARVSALSGVSTPLGWTQHVSGWGGDGGEMGRRRMAIEEVLAWRSDEAGLAALSALKVQYVLIGDLERQSYSPATIERLRARLKVVFEEGQTVILAVSNQQSAVSGM